VFEKLFNLHGDHHVAFDQRIAPVFASESKLSGYFLVVDRDPKPGFDKRAKLQNPVSR